MDFLLGAAFLVLVILAGISAIGALRRIADATERSAAALETIMATGSQPEVDAEPNRQ